MRYYSTQRPVMPGSYPNKSDVNKIVNFDEKTFCEDIQREAWGYIEYQGKLTKEQVEEYELVSSETKTYYCVISLVFDNGKVVSNIADTVEATCKPENTMRSTSRKDVYYDWFESYDEAQAFVDDANN